MTVVEHRTGPMQNVRSKSESVPPSSPEQLGKPPSIPPSQRRRRRRSSSMPKRLHAHHHHQKLIFQSPRCHLPDHDVFPSQCNSSSQSSTSDTIKNRWQMLSKIAGSHHQDGRVLKVNKRMSAAALGKGLPKAAAARVQTMHLPESDEQLPEWLDVVVSTLPNVKHLYLCANDDEEDEGARRLRRLYVLYRLPSLESIDGVAVLTAERELARPSSPNLKVNRQDWVEMSSDSLTEQQMLISSAVEVSLSGSIKLTEDTYTLVESSSSSSSSLTRARRDESNKLVTTSYESDGLSQLDSITHVRKYSKDTLDLDYDRFEYVAVESSTNNSRCDWSAACGALSIPYFQHSARRLKDSAETSKSLFRLRQKNSKRASFQDPMKSKSSGSSTRKGVGNQIVETTRANLSSSHERTTLLDPVLLAREMSDPLSPREMKNVSEKSEPCGVVPDDLPPETPETVGTRPPSTPARLQPVSCSAPLRSPRKPQDLHPDSNYSVDPCVRMDLPFSPSRRISGSESLTSPFPMQFRARAALSCSPVRRELKVTTKLNTYEENENDDIHKVPAPPPTPRHVTPSLHMNMAFPIPLIRVRSSPSKLAEQQLSRCCDLPPLRPVARPSFLVSPKTRRSRKEKWRRQVSARSTSILDEEEEHLEEGEDCSSDEENLNIQGQQAQ
jgi:hypothetical protein